MWSMHQNEEEEEEYQQSSLAPPKRIFCPVCKKRLGSKKPEDFCSYHCSECKATYQYYPGDKKPKAVLDAKGRPAKCGCGRCGR